MDRLAIKNHFLSFDPQTVVITCCIIIFLLLYFWQFMSIKNAYNKEYRDCGIKNFIIANIIGYIAIFIIWIFIGSQGLIAYIFIIIGIATEVNAVCTPNQGFD